MMSISKMLCVLLINLEPLRHSRAALKIENDNKYLNKIENNNTNNNTNNNNINDFIQCFHVHIRWLFI